ncbi:hypothetical protein FH972_008114 [Carpinus fangiana]|uniref:Uncharacterized protein n=1 Tax=Carpinus fangiana TaxID=176857 RepID=A0A5N6R117_9ROSI|nr:hypothetical protein FH972_008114 [Carpinus fangiana]
MAKAKKRLMSSAPWRGEEEAAEEFRDAKLKVTKQPGAEPFLQRVFSTDTLVKPLPPAMAYNVSRNLNFFTRIFTQFFDPEGIANAQKSLGIGQEEKDRRVR